jgi:hypothetical protein
MPAEATLDDLARFDARAARSLRLITAASAAELEGMALFFGADEDPRRLDEQVTLSNVHEFAQVWLRGAQRGTRAWPRPTLTSSRASHLDHDPPAALPACLSACAASQPVKQAKIDHILERQRVVQVERLTFGFRAVPLLDAHLDLLGVEGISSLLFDSASRVLCARTIVASLEWVDWPAASRVPAQLGRLLESFDQHSLRRFLRLATAQTVWPTGGFTPPISIQRSPPSASLPVGSTCFHIVRVPDYASEAELTAKMRTALDHVGEADFGYV